jgi:hypothetical protein
MTIQEAADLLKGLFTTYPHMDAYINGLPDPQATINDWRRLVAKLNHNHGAEAIRRMREGVADVPEKPWDIAMLPKWIKAVAGRVYDEEAKSRKMAEMRRAKREAAEHVGSAAAVAFGVSYRIALAASSCVVRGEITEERELEIVEYVKSMIRKDTDEAPQVPNDIRHAYDSPRGFYWSPEMAKKRTKKIRNTY